MVAVIYNGMAFSIYWTSLVTIKNWTTTKRKDFLQNLLSVIEAYNIKDILADREFIG